MQSEEWKEMIGKYVKCGKNKKKKNQLEVVWNRLQQPQRQRQDHAGEDKMRLAHRFDS